MYFDFFLCSVLCQISTLMLVELILSEYKNDHGNNLYHVEVYLRDDNKKSEF